jgi:hypothetical protein
MAEGHAAPKRPVFSGAKAWFVRHEQTLLIVNCINIALLFFLHIFGTTVPVSAPILGDIINAFAIILVSFIFVSVAWKGLVPAVVCMLGVVLMHNAIILPYFFSYQEEDSKPPSITFGDLEAARSNSAQFPSFMHFFLGLSMVVLAITLAFRPRFLFARNRPQSEEEYDVWSKYPIWYDNIKLVGHHREQMAPAKSLMEDKDRYLIWRYEYVLAYIYGAAHLVRPEGFVPKNDTTFIRDKESGLLMGKARYSGYFT